MFVGVPGGVVSVTLYTDENQAGTSWYLSTESSRTRFSASSNDFDHDVVSSVKVVGGSVTFYEQDYSGWQVTLAPGTYSGASLGFTDNQLSSLVLSCSITGCVH